jgi:hypothetical protein
MLKRQNMSMQSQWAVAKVRMRQWSVTSTEDCVIKMEMYWMTQKSATWRIYQRVSAIYSALRNCKNDGWTLGGNADAKGDIEIKFDIKIPTPKGVLYAMYHERKTEIVAPTMVTPGTGTGTGTGTADATIIHAPKRMSVKKAHAMLGHINEKAVRKTVIALGWELTRGTLGVCEPCT